MRATFKLLLSLVFCLLTGCATFVSGERADLGRGGIEYSLPVPIVRVTPQANGTIDVKVEYLPDPDNTYVLRTKSLISSYTLDVQRVNGMLTSVTLDAKADVIAQAVVESAGNIVKARSDALAKEQETAEKATKDQAKAIDEAQLSLKIAKAKLAALKKAKAESKLLDAKLAVAEAQAKFDYLTARAASGGSSYNDPGDGSSPNAAGPVIFRVVPAGEGVKLVALDGPDTFATSLAAKRQEKPQDIKAEIKEPNLLLRVPGNPLRFIILVSKSIDGVDLSLSKLEVVGTKKDVSVLVSAADVFTTATGSSVVVTLKDSTPKGSYDFTPVFTKKDSKVGPIEVNPVRINVGP